MKKYAMLALATIFMLSMGVKAQDQNPDQSQNRTRKEMKRGDKPMLSPEKRAEKMAKDLGLTPEEKVKVQALFEKQDVKRKEQMEKGEKVKAEMKEKFEAERKANDEELTKIIGQEKFQKFQVMRAERMGEMKGRMQEKMKERHEKNKNQSDNSTPQNNL